MVVEGDSPAIRRNPDVAQPAGAFGEDCPDGILEAGACPRLVDDRELLAVRGPVRVLDALENLAGRASREGNARQGSGRLPADDETPVQRDRELAVARCGEKV